MSRISQIKRERDRAARRLQMAIDSFEEYNAAVDRILEEAEVEAMSRPLKVVEIARLKEKDPSTVYRMGANHCQTYLELYQWVKENRPGLLDTIQKNYKAYD